MDKGRAWTRAGAKRAGRGRIRGSITVGLYYVNNQRVASITVYRTTNWPRGELGDISNMAPGRCCGRRTWGLHDSRTSGCSGPGPAHATHSSVRGRRPGLSRRPSVSTSEHPRQDERHPMPARSAKRLAARAPRRRGVRTPARARTGARSARPVPSAAPTSAGTARPRAGEREADEGAPQPRRSRRPNAAAEARVVERQAPASTTTAPATWIAVSASASFARRDARERSHVDRAEHRGADRDAARRGPSQRPSAT